MSELLPKRHILYHNYLFLFGFIYYLIIPLVVAQYNLFDINAFRVLGEYNITRFYYKYIGCCVIIFVSFYLGSYLTAHVCRWSNHTPRHEYKIKRQKSVLVLLPFIIFGIILLYINRASLFQGYLIEYDVACIGQIASIQLVCLFMLIYSLQSYKTAPRITKCTVILFSIALLSLGSRMYVLMPCISVLLYTIEYHKISTRALLIGMSVLVFLFLAVGLWRKGGGIAAEGLLYIGLAEPCYTWIGAESLFHYNKEFPLFAVPYQFISSFLNFIPTVLFPNKAEYISEISMQFDAPLGATNILVSLISNFGVIGSGIFMFLLGVCFTYIRKVKSSLFMKTYYLCICSVIPFLLFRDNFTIVNKTLFMNLLVYPLICVVLSKIVFGRRKYLSGIEQGIIYEHSH